MKNSSLWIRTAIIAVIALVGIYMVFGPRRMPNGNDFTLAGIKENLQNNIHLGLDLKGGSHLLMRVKMDEYLQKLTESNETAAITAAKEAKDESGAAFPVGAASHIAQPGNYQITLNVDDASKAQAVVDAINKKVDFKNSGWLESVSGGTITWSLPVQAQNKLKEQAVDQALKIIESRINTFGVKEPTLQKVGSAGSGQILLQMPGVEDPERVKQLIGAESHLMLMKVAGDTYQTYPTEAAAKQSPGANDPRTRRVLKLNERDDKPNLSGDKTTQPEKWMVVEYPPIVDGSELRDASTYTRGGNDYNIQFNLKPAGAQAFGDWTGKNIGKYLAVVLNDEIKSAPVIKGQIFDTGTIEGKFSKTSAEDLALTLKSGSLPANLDYQEERTVGPSLGADSIRAGVEASLGGLIFVIIFMLFYYRGAGINAVIALILNMLLTIAALVMIDSTLTLPGIAGLILGIGMAVDSNVLIFERMREEIRLGFSIPESINLGFDRAFVTIIDTHITTIISSVILYMYGSGPIRGFAVTLILGLLINLFTAVFVSRTIFKWLLERNPNLEKLSI
jgi:preprotein translocase subunit SecD